jgi:hypothetical protein
VTVRKGQPWGEPASGAPDVELVGDDADLAALVQERPGRTVWFRPDGESDLARAVGLTARDEPGALEVPVDALRVFDGEQAEGVVAVNAVVVGVPPDRLRWSSPTGTVDVVVDGRERFRGRATTVVVANGQFLRGGDVVPRGHPGDGRFEVQVYALGRRERASLRSRLPVGTHVPHPSITETSGREVTVTWSAPVPFERDGHRQESLSTVRVQIVSAALRLRV